MTRRQITRHILKASRKGKQLLSSPYYWGFVIAKKIVWVAAAYFLFSSPAQAALNYEDYPVVKLRSLDKITARTMTFEAKVGSTVRFGEIFIKVQSCRKPPPVEQSEAAAFLQVWQTSDDDKNKETSKWIFSGWMFASSPALSAMDHPVYDVWVLDCLGRDPEPIPAPEDNAPGVKAPETDGDAPDAVPPTVEPDKQVNEDVTREDDPGAYEADTPDGAAPAETAPIESVPASNMPADATPTPAPYQPTADTPDSYQDETPADDSSPVDDTITTTIIPPPSAQQPAPAAPAQSETLEPQPEEPAKQQEFQGIY